MHACMHAFLLTSAIPCRGSHGERSAVKKKSSPLIHSTQESGLPPCPAPPHLRNLGVTFDIFFVFFLSPPPFFLSPGYPLTIQCAWCEGGSRQRRYTYAERKPHPQASYLSPLYLLDRMHAFCVVLLAAVLAAAATAQNGNKADREGKERREEGRKEGGREGEREEMRKVEGDTKTSKGASQTSISSSPIYPTLHSTLFPASPSL